jgi:hypothetical protein
MCAGSGLDICDLHNGDKGEPLATPIGSYNPNGSTPNAERQYAKAIIMFCNHLQKPAEELKPEVKPVALVSKL